MKSKMTTAMTVAGAFMLSTVASCGGNGIQNLGAGSGANIEGLIVASNIELGSANPGSIYVINPDGRGKCCLTSNNMNTLPAWSFDGTKVAYTSNQGGNLDIWVMNADGSNPRALLSSSYGRGRRPWRDDPVQAGGPAFTCGR